jgi:molybdopterin/thiamine biosynthesis adenylyltransferase
MHRIAPWFRVFPCDEGGFFGVGHKQKKIDDAESWGKALRLTRYLLTPRGVEEIEEYVRKNELNIQFEWINEMGALVDINYFMPDGRLPNYIERNKHYWSLSYQDNGDAYKKLRSSSVSLVGCGGLGTNCALLLCASGIGSLKLFDPDKVDSSNLNRQFTYSIKDVGKQKVPVLKNFLNARFTHTKVEAIPIDIMDGLENLNNSKVVLCCADEPIDLPNCVQNYCAQHGIPYLNAGYIGNYAVVGPFLDKENSEKSDGFLSKTGAAGNLNEVEDINSRSKPASYATLNYLSAAIAVEEVVKYIIGRKDLVETRSARLGMELRSMSLKKINV